MARSRRQPDSLWSWLVCFASFITLTLHNGSYYAFGLLMPPLVDHFKQSKAITAWSGSLYLSIAYMMGPLVTYLCEKFGFRITAIGGSLLLAAGFCVSSFTNSFWFFFVMFALPTGFGGAASYHCSVLVIIKYFVKWRSLAVGITASSASVGLLAMSQITQVLLSNYGWRGAIRGWASLFVLTALCACTYDPNIHVEEETVETEQHQENPHRPRITYSSVIKNRIFMIYLASVSLVFFSAYISTIYLVEFAESDLGIPAGERVTLIYTYMAIAFFFSNHLFCKLSEFKFFNIFYLYSFSMTVYGIGLILLPFARTYEALVASFVIFGLMDGGRYGLMSLLVLECVGINKNDRAWGVVVFFVGTTAATGPLVIGFIADATDSFGPAFWSAGGIMVAGASLMVLTRFVKKTSDVIPENIYTPTTEGIENPGLVADQTFDTKL